MINIEYIIFEDDEDDGWYLRIDIYTNENMYLYSSDDEIISKNLFIPVDDVSLCFDDNTFKFLVISNKNWQTVSDFFITDYKLEPESIAEDIDYYN